MYGQRRYIRYSLTEGLANKYGRGVKGKNRHPSLRPTFCFFYESSMGAGYVVTLFRCVLILKE